MFFDPGQDPDDEQAMLYLYKHNRTPMIWVICIWVLNVIIYESNLQLK